MTTTITTASIERILIDLKFAMHVPLKERSPEWDISTGKLVGLAYLNFVNQADDKISLRTLALANLAVKYGCKSAKKTTFNLTRWAKSEPPPIISACVDEEEFRAATKIFESIVADWVLAYAIKTIIADKSSHSIKDLVNWAIKNSKEVTSLFDEILKQSLTSNISIEQLINVIKQVSKNPKFTEKIGINSPFSNISALLAYCDRKSFEDFTVKNKGKVILDLQCTIFEFIDHLSSINPNFLFLNSSVELIRCTTALSKSPPKALNVKSLSIVKKVLNLISWALPFLDASAKAGFKSLLQGYKETLPVFENQFKLLIGQDFNSFKWDISDFEPQNIKYPLEDALLSLIPDWDDYLVKHPNEPALEQIGGKIIHIAKLRGIQKDGLAGSLVDYSPLKHQLVDLDASSFSKVRILKPGLLVTREDGVGRILLKALVEIA